MTRERCPQGESLRGRAGGLAKSDRLCLADVETADGCKAFSQKHSFRPYEAALWVDQTVLQASVALRLARNVLAFKL